MRRAACVLFSTIFLVVLLTGLGAFAQEPKIAISVPPSFTVDADGCITVPAPTSVWAITGGAWARPEVKGFLIKINPFLAEARRQFNWHDLGEGSGVLVFTTDHLCGFTSVKTDANLAITSLSTADFEKLRAEKDAAIKKASLARVWIIFYLGMALFFAFAGVLAFILNKRQTKQLKAQIEELQNMGSQRVEQLSAERQKHIQEIQALRLEFGEKLVEIYGTVNDKQDAIAKAVADTHALYNPFDGPAVVEGGLQPTNPAAVESNMMETAYADYAGDNAAFLPFASALASGLYRRVAPITFGYMNGDGCKVRNADGKHSPKNLRNQPGYHTRVAFPNGNEQDVYSLMSCCNPVLRGDWIEASDHFTFTPAPIGGEILPTPKQEPTKVLLSADGKIRVVITGSSSAEAKDGDGSLMVIVDRPPSPAPAGN